MRGHIRFKLESEDRHRRTVTLQYPAPQAKDAYGPQEVAYQILEITFYF